MQAGDYATVVILSGSFLRPVGGWLADRIGGYRLLLGLFVCVSACLVVVGSLPPIAFAVPALFLGMSFLGMGNGAVFQIAPRRFRADIELTTGIVGAAGGLGGFFLPSAIGALKDLFGSYGYGVLCFAALVLAATFLLLEFGVKWSSTWSRAALDRTMVFRYRSAGSTSLPDAATARLQSAEE